MCMYLYPVHYCIPVYWVQPIYCTQIPQEEPTMEIPLHLRRKLELGRPADFSFKKLTQIKAIGLEGARYTRIGGVPERGPEKRFLTKSLWLNNNKLKTTKNIEELVNEALEYPKELGWLDFSFNYITEIHESLLQFPNLKILYFHGNCLTDLNEVFKLRPLKELRSVTFHGNPIANHPRYRNYVISVLPQIVNLDFTPITQTEKQFAMPPEVVRKLKEEKEKFRQEVARNKKAEQQQQAVNK